MLSHGQGSPEKAADVQKMFSDLKMIMSPETLSELCSLYLVLIILKVFGADIVSACLQYALLYYYFKKS